MLVKMLNKQLEYLNWELGEAEIDDYKLRVIISVIFKTMRLDEIIQGLSTANKEKSSKDQALAPKFKRLESCLETAMETEWLSAKEENDHKNGGKGSKKGGG